MARMTWSYLAGFFDGEGCISIARQRTRTYGCFLIEMAQTGQEGKEVTEEIKEFLESQEVRSELRSTGKPNRRTVWDLRIRNRDSIRNFIKGVFPYLRVKKVKCQDVLRYMTAFPSLRGMGCMVSVPRDRLIEDRKSGMRVREMARRYGITEPTIRSIIRPSYKKKRYLMWS